MIGARLFAMTGATRVDAQIGRAGVSVSPPGPRGAVAGDYALFVHCNPPNGAWTNLSGPTSFYGKVLNASELGMTYAPSDDWGLLIYRDVNSAAVRSASGFAKSAAYAGIVAGYEDNAFTTTSPAGLQQRLSSSNPYFTVYDLVGPGASYQDGTPFLPGDPDTWTVLELLRV